MAKKTVKKTRPAVGNPSDTASAAALIDQLIAGLDDWRGQRLADIRQMIHEADPKVVEEWKWRGTPVWSHDGMLLNANAFKAKVKITFHHGAHLNDPKQLFNNGLDGNQWRAIDLGENDTLPKTAFKALIREAIRYNQAHDVPKSKGSTALKRTSKTIKKNPNA